ncbi:hypothetical protein CDL15_Pgr013844 [Punica granatum]|uniref:Uncharacterized protein n=1 Tax=Punica granatum TaxID=22663 RepID=A0A218WJA2_PUNGR|nr:hypothetical protein CDL15_Pgr013844 [Punica granatum]
MDTKSWTRSLKSGKDGYEVLDAKFEKRQRWTRSPGLEVRKAAKMDTKSWTRSPKSSKDGREVRKAIKMDTKSWTRSPKSDKDGHEVLDAKSEKQ